MSDVEREVQGIAQVNGERKGRKAAATEQCPDTGWTGARILLPCGDDDMDRVLGVVLVFWQVWEVLAKSPLEVIEQAVGGGLRPQRWGEEWRTRADVSPEDFESRPVSAVAISGRGRSHWAML